MLITNKKVVAMYKLRATTLQIIDQVALAC